MEAPHCWQQLVTLPMAETWLFGTHCCPRGRLASLLSSKMSCFSLNLFLGLSQSMSCCLLLEASISDTICCSCHDAGAACLAHATQHQLLLSAGKKGLVSSQKSHSYAFFKSKFDAILHLNEALADRQTHRCVSGT